MNSQYPQYSEYPQYQGLYYDDYYWPNDPYHGAFQPPLTDTNYWLNYSDVTPLEPPAIYNCDWLDHPNEIQAPVLPPPPAPRPIPTSSLSSSFSETMPLVTDSLALVNDDYPFNSNPSGEIQPPAVANIDERPTQSPQYQQQYYLPDYNAGYYSSVQTTNSYNSSSSTTETTPPSGENVQPISMQLETRREGEGRKASNNSNKPTKKYKCNYDGCRFSSSKSGNLKTHLRTHTGERPFECGWEGCDEKFTQSGNLKTHLRTHTGEKPFECSWKGCDQKFADPSALKGHYRTHTGEKPFKCGWKGCGLKFAQSENLKRHLSYHTRNGPFKCQLCGCSFFNAGSFSNHMICHTSHDADKENQVEEMVDNKEKRIDEQPRKRSRDAMTDGDASEEEEEEEMSTTTSKPKRQSTLRQIDYSQFF